MLTSTIKSNLKCTCIYAADVKSRQHFHDIILAGYGLFCLKGLRCTQKIQNKGRNANGSLIKVESIAECYTFDLH